MMEEQARAHLYTRVSTSGQLNDGHSVPAQVTQGVAYAAFKNLDLGQPVKHPVKAGRAITAPERTYIDGVSAYHTNFRNRPEGQRLMGAVRRGDHVVISKLDRGFRDVRDCLNTLEALQQVGVTMHILDIGVDCGRPEGKMLITILCALAEWESARRSERVREAYWQAVKDGKDRKWKMAPPGYVFKEVGGRKVPVANPEEQIVMWAIWTLYLAGYPVDKIILALERHGVRTPYAVRQGTGQRAQYGQQRISKIIRMMTVSSREILGRPRGEDLARRIVDSVKLLGKPVEKLRLQREEKIRLINETRAEGIVVEDPDTEDDGRGNGRVPRNGEDGEREGAVA
jgi:DNA invertase Pin-like site-specific DNA recombinase